MELDSPDPKLAGLAEPQVAHRIPVLPVLMNAAALSALLFVIIAGSDWLAIHKHVPEQIMLMADLIVAVTGGILFMKVTIGEQSRVLEERAHHRAVLLRVAMIGDLNHHVRNALELIQLSAHTTHNQELIRNVQSSVDRIEWALRELVPPAGEAEPRD